jgi:hypothetical protein
MKDQPFIEEKNEKEIIRLEPGGFHDVYICNERGRPRGKA